MASQDVFVPELRERMHVEYVKPGHAQGFPSTGIIKETMIDDQGDHWYVIENDSGCDEIRCRREDVLRVLEENQPLRMQ